MSYLLDAIVDEVWTKDVLPEGIAAVGLLNGRYAWARPERYQGRHGFSVIDENDIGQPYEAAILAGQYTTLMTAVDNAISRAVCCSWFDSSYR